ncbi:hypothetical protein P8452_74725 [Trifolium repens]|nr:hypothetical protein P8452_74725 [Trifolium repens]
MGVGRKKLIDGEGGKEKRGVIRAVFYVNRLTQFPLIAAKAILRHLRSKASEVLSYFGQRHKKVQATDGIWKDQKFVVSV